jgi:hypothetical protein
MTRQAGAAHSQYATDIIEALATHGLVLRGGFDFADAGDRPVGPSRNPARSILLVGSAGAGWWAHFCRWRAKHPSHLANPLDTWSRDIIGRIAEDVGARLVMPNDRPYAPFQQWAMRAEGLKRSPLGLLMHPDFGLWQAYRAALLFDTSLPEELNRLSAEPIHLCDACIGKPCLKSCPVDAYSQAGFAYQRCLDHVRGDAGAPCRSGCLDRNACPYGAEFRYPVEVQAFFQRAFARLP